MINTFVFINNKLYQQIIKDKIKSLKEVPFAILAGRSIRDIYQQDNCIMMEVI